jgi:hypothetical protein
VAASGTHTLTLEGTSAGDNTALVDNLAIQWNS